MAEYGEPAALVVGESERPVVELGPQRAVLLKERGEGLGLALVAPGASGHVEPAQGHRIDHVAEDGTDAPICQDTRLGCLRDVSAHAEVCHNTLVDFTREETFEAADDLASGPAASRPAGDVVDRRLVEPHADDDRAMEGGVRLSVAAPIETMPAGRHPGRSRDRTGTAQLRKGGF